MERILTVSTEGSKKERHEEKSNLIRTVYSGCAVDSGTKAVNAGGVSPIGDTK